MSTQKSIDDGEFALLRGLYDPALSGFKKALQMATATGDTALAAEALRGMAKSHEGKEEFDGMARCAADALKQDLDFWGAESVAVGHDARLCGRAAAGLLKNEEAQRYFEQALSVLEPLLPEEHESLVSTRCGLLLLALQAGEQDRCRQLHDRLLPTFIRVKGDRQWVEFIQLDHLVERLKQLDKQPTIDAVLKQELDVLQRDFATYEQELRDTRVFYNKFRSGIVAAQAAPAPQSQMAGFRATTPSSAQVKMPPPQANMPATAANATAQKPSGFMEKMTAGFGKVQMSGKLRAEIPYFIDDLIFYLQIGLAAKDAMVKLAEDPKNRYPTIAKELKTAVELFKSTRKPIAMSLRDLGERHGVGELTELGSTLAAAEKSGSSVGYQLAAQSEALRAHLKAMKQRQENTLRAFKPMGFR